MPFEHIFTPRVPVVRNSQIAAGNYEHNLRQLGEDAVRGAYQIEYAATIIDADAQAKFTLTADEMEALKSEAAVYAKTLDMQSLTDRIERCMKDMALTEWVRPVLTRYLTGPAP